MTEEQDFKIDLYKDLIFRALFGDESAKYALKCLLNAVMNQAELPLIAELELGNPFQLPSFYDGKFSIMDIHAIDETGRHFDIEMQLQPQRFFGDRLFYYGAGLYGSSLEQGEGYTELPKVVCVAFINFPLSEQRPDVWFDVWQMHSTLGTGLGTDKVTSIFVRLPRVFDQETSPPDIFTGQLVYWVKILSSYAQLTA
ncbi:MAG: Rpn family recombination-promoting nuclease/putative transposase, partial [Thermoguttaceae bacterium]|nr:Rpn family recombination-promoting nuclease/putative transposase [Thermoguttaceae bacterium]